MTVIPFPLPDHAAGKAQSGADPDFRARVERAKREADRCAAKFGWPPDPWPLPETPDGTVWGPPRLRLVSPAHRSQDNVTVPGLVLPLVARRPRPPTGEPPRS